MMPIIESGLPELVERFIVSNAKFGPDRRSLRPEQIELLPRIVKHLLLRWEHSANAPVGLQEAEPGIGKTLVLLLTAMLSALEGRRTVIAINTTSLRDQLFADVPLAQAALEGCCAAFGRSSPPKITVAQLISISQYISPSKVKHIEERIDKTSLTTEERASWTNFSNFVVNFDDGDRIDIHQWYNFSGGEPIPLGLDVLSLTPEERSDPELVASLKANQQQAHSADILIVTHTMLRLLTWKLRRLDQREKLGLLIPNDCGSYENLLVDEAHMFPKSVRSWNEASIRFKAARELLDSCPIDILEAREAFNELESYVTQEVGNGRTKLLNNAAAYHPFIERLYPTYDLLCKVLDSCDDIIFTAKLETLLAAMETFITPFSRAGGSGTDEREATSIDAYPILFRHRTEYGMSFKPGRLVANVSALWRRNPDALNERLFKSVFMISGTLTNADPDPQDPYRYFRHEMGAIRVHGHEQEVIWYGNPIKARNLGSASMVVYCERATELWPTVKDGEVNQAHTNYIADMIAYIHHHPEKTTNRILALFMSEAALLGVDKCLRERHPELVTHIIAQRAGMRFVGKPRDIFRKDKDAILLSLNWQGINAVDTADRSIVDHLVITKVPFMPADERRKYEVAHGSMEIRIMFNEAVWLFRQAIGRARRDPSANFVLWLGDPRVPLPDEMSPPFSKYTDPPQPSMTTGLMARLYDLFDRHVSLQLFGRTGKSRTGLLAGTVRLGYLRRRDDCDLELKELDVALAPRPGD